MSIEPYSRSKTIDDLGIGTSVRYAKDQEYLDKTFSKASVFVPEQTQIDVSVPCFSSEFDMMFEISQRNKGWAAFLTPPGFKEQKKRLFTFQILPSLGPEEAQQIHADRIRSRLETDRAKRKKEKDKKEREGREKKAPFEEDIEFQEEEKESEVIIRLIELISNLDRILVEINSRRNQYQRG
jgi:hypothetical protein